MTDKIEKSIVVAAPIERVWQAVTDHREFGRWFRVDLEGPFVVGQDTRGKITHPGFEHLQWKAGVLEMDAPRRFVFTWHPYAIDPSVDYDQEEPTTVTFTLAPSGKGTLVTVTEAGFDKVPAHRRDEALRMNTGGWEAQMRNIKTYVES